jgi:hypothetical protein
MTNIDEYYEFRDALAAAVVRDLVGPARQDSPREDEDVLTEAPMTRYIAGVLYPLSPDPIDPAQDNDDADAPSVGTDETVDPPVAMASVRYPSAMGLTCGVDRGAASSIRLTVTGARYRREDGEDRDRWMREPIHVSCDIPLKGEENAHRQTLADGLEIFVRERRPAEDGHSALTVALLNTHELPAGEWRRDAHCFFQVEFDLDAHGDAAFVDRSRRDGLGVDSDAESYALLYRHSPTFATGHGCGASWTVDHEDAARATSVRSATAPTHDLLLSDNNPDVDSPFFSMRRLVESPREDVLAGLVAFVDGYRAWIEARRAEVDDLPGSLTPTAHRHLGDCKEAADRIEAGIELLRTVDHAWEAFRLANQAMLVQRARADWARSGGAGELDLTGDVHRWRAFQLGFILMTLQGVADPGAKDRRVVDLLWFPTGGGKTEAYLGLIAFTIFLRRLRSVADHHTGAGMTVIMRYTLRLLTLQQYQRAAALICACEAIRRTRDDLGTEEISICLWVGKASTPLTLKDAQTALDKLRSGATLQENNPVQLRQCPWCATKLSHKNYWVADRDKRLVIACRNPACTFEKGLPCYLVDEDVYNRRPTLMIATVDKFASIPWRDSIGPLFNMGASEHAPELIIQDELHLISGPLGTMVGLYETALQMLCSEGDVGPKVIASTATIRRAEQQIRKLYGASSFQFPPPGLDARDSYFAVEVPRQAKGTRRYLGLMAPGSSHATLLVRSYAALLQHASEIDGDDAVKDPYWTLLGYFNSLRVLGAAYLQVRDDVCDRIQVISSEGKARLTSDSLEMIEMTSRVESSEVPGHLERMDLRKDEAGALDVVLATNMISVGVDIDRLGLMAVMGQPQSSSEYIQATSRVGRRHPGLVLVLLNSARSRDRSHYEDFESFHGSIYRQVDASSVTPFAARARDRALHAVFIGMLRARWPEYRPNRSAANVTDLDRLAEPVINQILARVRATEPAEEAGTEAGLREILKDWKYRAERAGGKLVFQNRKHPELALLADAGRPDIVEATESFGTMWSMRAVDTESNLYLVKG